LFLDGNLSDFKVHRSNKRSLLQKFKSDLLKICP
jgi:hypothetical protein